MSELAVVCPRCYARAGAPCVTNTGRRAPKPHSGRRGRPYRCNTEGCTGHIGPGLACVSPYDRELQR